MVEVDDGDSQSGERDHGSHITPVPVSAPFGLQFGLGRHRRLFHRQTRPTSTAMLNPEAADFVPKMPTKRKASLSAKAGESTASSSLPASLDLAREPIIKSKDLFGIADSVGYVNHSATFENLFAKLESEDDAEQQPVVLQATQGTHIPPHPGLGGQSVRTRVLRMKQDHVGENKVQPRLSVVLVSLPSDASVNGRMRYLPLCSASQLGRASDEDHLVILPSHRERIEASAGGRSPPRVSWPPHEVPVEIFDLITSYLARDDVKSMRLVDHEFEQKVSRSLFHTSVVPFNTELYDMVEEEARTRIQQPATSVIGKGKGRATPKQAPLPRLMVPRGSLYWKNAKEDVGGKVYKNHGLRVFSGFGPHIKRYGMSFEVSESQLLQLPSKKELDHVDAYHGNYDWPPPHYARFDNLAGLEHTADETSRMKDAFGKLEIVQELALSVDSGLGWMSGPDVSLHARIFQRPTAVFGRSNDDPDHEMQAASDFWTALQRSQASFSQHSPKEVSLAYRELQTTPAELNGLKGTIFAGRGRWMSIDAHRVLPNDTPAPAGKSRFGVLYTTSAQAEAMDNVSLGAAVTPSELRKEQKEWLLETEWAQRAFLESYMLAVIDNPPTFEGVTRLNIAKLSSGFLPTIVRQQFWDALPSLQIVTLHVSPHWRSVAKDNAGFAETTAKSPSGAVTLFYSMLRIRLSTIETIKKLDIGWVDGGEHAQGMFARNTNILPVPITQLEQSMAATGGNGVLVFKHVEELTLTNCWITPLVLESLVKRHAPLKLKKLTLCSVSLTAHPRFTAPAQPAAIPPLMPGNGNAQQQPPQMPNLGNVPPPFINLQHAPNAQQLAQMQQHWLQHQMLQQHMGNAPFFNPANQPQAQAQNPPPLPAAPTNPPQPQQPSQPWTEGHREGSWPFLLDRISPGPAFEDFQHSRRQDWEERPARPHTSLTTLHLISCGYARLQHALFDQSTIEMGTHMLSHWFRVRQATLKPFMLESKERYLGTIVQHLPQREVDALQLAWQLAEGWSDAAKAEEAEWDGLMAGGTGRFSGVVSAAQVVV